jgi:hypothetical protein
MHSSVPHLSIREFHPFEPPFEPPAFLRSLIFPPFTHPCLHLFDIHPSPPSLLPAIVGFAATSYSSAVTPPCSFIYVHSSMPVFRSVHSSVPPISRPVNTTNQAHVPPCCCRLVAAASRCRLHCDFDPPTIEVFVCSASAVTSRSYVDSCMC